MSGTSGSALDALDLAALLAQACGLSIAVTSETGAVIVTAS